MKIIDRLIDRLAVRIAEETVARQDKPTVINVTNHADDRAHAANLGEGTMQRTLAEIELANERLNADARRKARAIVGTPPRFWS